MALDFGESVSVCVIQSEGPGRAHLSEVLRRAHVELIGLAADVISARELLANTTPDVLIVDLSSGDAQYLSLLSDGLVPEETRVLGVLAEGDEATFFLALELGMSGWLDESEPPERVLQAVFEMNQGGVPISARFSPFLVERVRPLVTRQRAPDEVAARPKLTPRERETLQFVAKGFSVAEVASLLKISRHTVTTHVRSIYRKLEVHSRSAAIYEALALGILQQL